MKLPKIAFLLAILIPAMVSASPVITLISPILSQETQTIVITGSGFGTMKPYNGDSSYIKIRDITANWNAGSSLDAENDYVTLNITSWTDTQITISGFAGSYGSGRWKLNDKDVVSIQIWNAQTDEGPAGCLQTVNNSSPSSCPTIWIDDAQGQIGIVNVATGSATVIGNSGVILTDIAFDPNGNLYGITFDTLYSINKATGVATEIGPLGVTDANSLVFSPSGVLYAAGNKSNNLYTINTKTGSARVIFNTGYSSGGDLAFLNGNLYYTDAANLLLIKFNPTTKTTTLIGPIGSYPFYGLAVATNGVLYGVANNSIYSISTSTGAGTLVSTYANGL